MLVLQVRAMQCKFIRSNTTVLCKCEYVQCNALQKQYFQLYVSFPSPRKFRSVQGSPKQLSIKKKGPRSASTGNCRLQKKKRSSNPFLLKFEKTRSHFLLKNYIWIPYLMRLSHCPWRLSWNFMAGSPEVFTLVSRKRAAITLEACCSMKN